MDFDNKTSHAPRNLRGLVDPFHYITQVTLKHKGTIVSPFRNNIDQNDFLDGEKFSHIRVQNANSLKEENKCVFVFIFKQTSNSWISRAPMRRTFRIKLKPPLLWFLLVNVFLGFWHFFGTTPSFGNLARLWIERLKSGHLAFNHHTTLTLINSKIYLSFHSFPLKTTSFFSIQIAHIMAYHAIVQINSLHKKEAKWNQERKQIIRSR